jgi:hypothetical protein
MHSYDVFHDYEKSRWAIKDLPWEQLDRSKVRPEYIRLAHSAIMGESNSVAALHGFLNESTHDYDFAAFASLWAAEELQHHFAFRSYVERVGGESFSEDAVRAMRQPYPPGVTHASTLATNIISELTVCHVYHEVSKSVDEPVLREMLSQISRDEARHAREFILYTRRRLGSNPEELSSVLETLYVYVADPDKRIKHPVSVFKSRLPELSGHETIDDGFDYFLRMDASNHARLSQKLFSTFSSITGHPLTNAASIRRALISV